MFFWAVLEKNIPFLFNFVFTIVIARLVSPDAYGLVAMTAIITALATVLQNMGFSPCLVQKENLEANDATTVFVTNVAIGGLIAAVLFIFAHPIAAFFEREEVAKVVQVNAITVFVAALGIVQTAMLQREYRFRIGLLIEVIAIVGAGAVALLAALRGLDLWALLLLSLVRQALQTFLLWSLIGWRPRGRFSAASFREMWEYARHMIGASLYHHLVTNMSSLLLGKLYSATTLGLFSRAQSLQVLPVSLMTQPVQRVAFPLYSRSQSNIEELRRLLRMHSRVVSVLAGIVTACLTTSAHEIVLILVGENWVEAVPMLQVIALAAFFNISFPLHSEANKAIGKSRWFFWIEIIKRSFLLMMILLGVINGVGWLLAALVVSSVVDYVLSATSSVRFIGYTWRQQISDIGPALLWSVLAVLAVHWIAGLFLPASLFAALALKVGTVFSIFGFAVLTSGTRAFPEIHAQFRHIFRRAKQATVPSEPNGSGR